MNSTIDKKKDGSIELILTFPWTEIKKTYDKTVDELVKNIEIKGFRKGKAPRNRAEKQLDKNMVYEHVIKEIVPVGYRDAITKHAITPIMQPNIRLVSAKEGEDWSVEVTTCERPDVTLSNYKSLIQSAKGEIKKDELWIPGKSNPSTDEDKESIQKKRQKQLNIVLEYLIKNVDIMIPSAMIKQEVDARLSRLVDEITKLGLTIETYAKSKGVSPDILRRQHEQEVINTFKLEFILEKIAELEKITVDEKEIDETISKLSNEKEREELTKNKYYMANLLRRQKTLDRLLSL